MTAGQITFVCRMVAAAVKVEPSSGRPPDQARILTMMAVAQGCLEAATIPKPDGSGGWGTSTLYVQANNPFGIKFSQHDADYGFFDAPTWEVINGQKENCMAEFQRYPSLDVAIAEHQALLLHRPCVVAALAVGFEAVADALGPWTPGDIAKMKALPPQTPDHADYSTSPTYPATLKTLANQLRLADPRAVQWWATGADPALKP